VSAAIVRPRQNVGGRAGEVRPARCLQAGRSARAHDER